MDAEAIRALRAERGWTQAELAARLNTDPVTVSRWERGASSPRPSAVARLESLVRATEFDDLVAVLGRDDAIRALRRAVLLRGPRNPSFPQGDLVAKIRAVDQARRAQLELKRALAGGDGSTGPRERHAG